MSNQYYTAPSQESFEDMKQCAINIWKGYDDTFNYATQKINRIKDIVNFSDNFMHIMAMFDINNQRKLVKNLKPKTIEDVKERLLAGGISQEFINSIFLL